MRYMRCDYLPGSTPWLFVIVLSFQEEELKKSVMELEDKVQSISERNSHVVEANKDLETNLTVIQTEIENLLRYALFKGY